MTQVVTVTTAEDEEYLIMEMGRKGTRGSRGRVRHSWLDESFRIKKQSLFCLCRFVFFFKVLNNIFLTLNSFLHRKMVQLVFL